MKKSVIALALVSTFTAATASAATAEMDFTKVSDVISEIKNRGGTIKDVGANTSMVNVDGKNYTVRSNGDEYFIEEAGRGGNTHHVETNAEGKVTKVNGESAHHWEVDGNELPNPNKDVNKEQIENNRENINNNGNNIDRNEKQIDKNSSKIDANGNKIDHNGSKIDANSNKINDNRTDIDRNRDQADRNSQNIDKNSSKIDINSNKIDANKKELENKADKAVKDIYKNAKDAADYVEKAANDYHAKAADAYNGLDNKIGKNSRRIDSLENDFKTMAKRQDAMENRMDRNEGKMSNGVAGVAAMANIPTVAGKTTIGGGMGYFNGSKALAVGASTSFDNGISLKGSVAYAQGKFNQKDTVIGAGVGYSF